MATLHQWCRGGYEERFRYEFPLDSGSLVWNFMRECTEEISSRHGCSINIFETVQTHAQKNKGRLYDILLPESQLPK